MKLTSMKIPKAKTEPSIAEAPTMDRPRYPYGLRLRLDEDQLAQLGIDELPKVGGVVTVHAKADVISVSENEHTSEDRKEHKHRTVELQITDLGFDTPGGKDAAAELYGA